MRRRDLQRAAARDLKRAAARDLKRAAARLSEKLEADPLNADRWLQLARTSGSLRRWDAAVDAYRHAISLGLAGSESQVGPGEMLVMQAGGIVTPAAQDAFGKSLKDDPNNEIARYYMARAAAEAGHPREAIGLLQALLADMPEDSAMRDAIGGRSRMPRKPPACRCRSLPKGSRPRRLRPSRVRPGRLRPGRLRPKGLAIRLQAIEGRLTGLKPAATLPPRALPLLRQLETIDPDQPEVPLVSGSRRPPRAHPEDAGRSWTRLLARLPNTRPLRITAGLSRSCCPSKRPGPV